MNTIGAVAYVGEGNHPNRITGRDIFVRWEAALVPLRECEGNGWYGKSQTKAGWSFRFKALHKGWFTTVLDDSTWNEETLEQLVEKAVRDTHKRYCAKPKVCRCGQGYRSNYDDKCGHCRTTKEQKTHMWKIRNGPQRIAA